MTLSHMKIRLLNYSTIIATCRHSIEVVDYYQSFLKCDTSIQIRVFACIIGQVPNASVIYSHVLLHFIRVLDIRVV